MNSLRTIIVTTGAISLLLGSLAGCEEKPKSTSSSAPKPDDNPVLDPNLGKAIAASSAPVATGKRPGAAPTSKDEPPTTGVFEKERADALHAVGAPVHIELGIPGTEPRVSLVPTSFEMPKKLNLRVATMVGPRQGLPSVELTFDIKMDKPQKEGDDAGVPKPIAVSTKVTKAELSKQQLGTVPEAAAQAVRQMKNSKLAWSFLPGGGVTGLSLERSTKTQAELEHNLVAVAEAIAAASIAPPSEPLGQGAAWIVRSRDAYGGLDLISYRMCRLEKIDGNEFTLAVEIRQYAVGSNISKAGLPDNGGLLQMAATGSGEFVFVRGKQFAKSGTLKHTLQLGLRPLNGAANQMIPLSLRSTITL